MSRLSYADLVRELFPRLAGGVRWGLERTEALLRSVGSPHLSFRVVHVGGTNGKGSVAASVASVLTAAGHRTGLYTSPHLCTFRERMRVDGRPLSEEAILAAANRLWPLIEESGATFFEATTAIAFLAFAEAGVEWAVVEVGLGGRLDATNVVRPEVVVLTNVALDHTDMLGGTRRRIAAEKAGIVKPGAPVVTGETDAAVLDVFREHAAAAGAPLHLLAPDELGAVACSLEGTRFRLATRAWGELELTTPLVGPHQATNAALAVRALECLDDDARPTAGELRAGLERVRWPGRLQVERVGGAVWLFDGAHNPAAADALAAALRRLAPPRPRVFVAGILADKAWPGMLATFARLADHLVLTVPPSAPPHRRWDPAAAAERVRGTASVIVEPAFGRALELAAGLAAPGGEGEGGAPGGSVVVTGSLHTVGDALLALGRAPAEELLDLGEGASLPAAAARG